MPVDVSVIVPFFNPGADIDDCLASVLAQTLPRDRFDVVLVDDGSTDGSRARVEEWESKHPDLLSVHHLPTNGGPGGARNVGIDVSDGRYIQFLDSDDTLGPRALERMLELADSSDADVVVGKLSSDFRGVHHPIFRRTVSGRTLADFPLMLNLTVCKMFRRDFLMAHEVRFPEGPHYIEDEHFCVQAYAHARSVAIVGDTACYFYRRRRTGGRHVGDARIIPSDYYRELAAILDVVETQVSSAAARSAAQSRFYRNEMLSRLRGPAMLTYNADHRRELVSEVRHLATTRFPPELREGLPAFHRTQSRLLLDNDLDGLIEFARLVQSIRLRATTTPPTWRDGSLVVSIDAPLRVGEEPFRLERDGEGWLLPEAIAPGVSAADRRLGESDDADLDLDLATVSRSDSQLWSTTQGLTLEIDADGCPRVGGEVHLDPGILMGGGALTAGVWGVRLRVIFAGLPRSSLVRPAPYDETADEAWLTTANRELHSVTAFWTGRSPTLAFDVDEWSRSVHDVVADRLVAVPQVDADRLLVIAAPGLRGPVSDVADVSLILEPLDSPDLAVVNVSARLLIRPEGSTIRATIPALPPSSTRWALWLRTGEVGGAPPRRLPVALAQTDSGQLHAERSAD